MSSRSFINKAPLLPLSVAINTTDTVLQVSSTTGYPNAPFTLAIDRGTSKEEVVLCTAKTSNTFTVTRGYDGTTAVSHSTPATIEHTTAAIDYAEANAHVNGTGDVHAQYLLKSVFTGKGALAVGQSASTPAVLAVGANNLVLLADSAVAGGLKWGQIVGASITDGTITLAKLDSALAKRVIQTATSGTLPGSPTNGEVVYQTDNDRPVIRAAGAWAGVPFGAGKITASTGAPSGGVDGDLWLRYT